jgi:hypothetical protein
LKSQDKLERNSGQHVKLSATDFILILKNANEEREQLIHSQLRTRKEQKKKSRRLAASGATVREIARRRRQRCWRPRKKICVFLKILCSWLLMVDFSMQEF